MKTFLTSLACVSVILFPVTSFGEREPTTCNSTLSTSWQVALRARMTAPLAPNQFAPHVLLDQPYETPDPDKPLPIWLNKQKIYIVGLSGQSALIVTSLDELRYGSPSQILKVKLFNRHGYAYGEEDLPYALGSGAWDLGFAWYRGVDGEIHYKVYAGVMGDEPDGRPATIHMNYSRQRMSFDLHITWDDKGNVQLSGRNPRPIFAYRNPIYPNWVLRDERGAIAFSHFYGGVPIRLENGEPYLNINGFPEMEHEMVVEQTEVLGEDGILHVLPQRTVIARAPLDPTLSYAVGPSEIVLDVYDGNGHPYPATRRTNGGLLVEGPQSQIRINEHPAMSMDDVRDARAHGFKIRRRTSFSPGDYFLTYGGSLAETEDESGPYKAVEKNGDHYNFLAPIAPLFVGLGRGVFYVDDSGQEMMLFHAAPAGLSSSDSLPTLEAPQRHPDFLSFRRGILSAPVRFRNTNEGTRLRLLDSVGLLRAVRHEKLRSILNKPHEPREIDPPVPDRGG